MEEPEVKQALTKRTTCKGVFTRHRNTLQRLLLVPFDGNEEQYNDVMEKLKSAYERYETEHSAVLEKFTQHELETDEVEAQAVDLDTQYTEILTKAAAWKNSNGQDNNQPEGTTRDELEKIWKEKLSEVTESRNHETKKLQEQINMLSLELERTKLSASIGQRPSSTPLLNRGGTERLSGLSGILPTLPETDIRSAEASVHGDTDERSHVRNKLFYSTQQNIHGLGESAGGASDLHSQLWQQSMLQHQSLMASMNAPVVKLEVFDGNPLRYTAFMQAYTELVDNILCNDRKKLMILQNHCVGKAKVVVDSCMHLSAKEGIEIALRSLKTKFGSAFKIRQAWIERIMAYPTLTTPDVIESFAYELECCKHSLRALGQLSEIECTNSLQLLVAKLPMYLRVKWRKQYREHVEQPNGSPLDILVRLVREAAEDANDPAFGENAIERVRNTYMSSGAPSSRVGKTRHSSISKRMAVNAIGASDEKDLSQEFEEAEVFAIGKGATNCAACKSSTHFTFRCHKYRTLEPSDRLALVRKMRLCHLCMSEGHLVTACPLPWKCQEKECGLKHHTSLHRAFAAKSQTTCMTSALGVNDQDDGELEQFGGESARDSVDSDGVYLTVSAPCLPLTPVILKNGDKSVTSYALLDTGSTMTICTNAVKKKLGLKSLGKKDINVNTVTSEDKFSGDIVEMDISAEHKDDTYPVFRALSVEKLPISLEHVARGSALSKWKHLKDIKIPVGSADKVDILIGQNNAHLLEQFEKVKGGPYEPYAVNTKLGWTVFGNLNENTCDSESLNFVLGEEKVPASVVNTIESCSSDMQVCEKVVPDCLDAHVKYVEEKIIDYHTDDFDEAYESREDCCMMSHDVMEEGICMASEAEFIPDTLIELLEQFWRAEEVPKASKFSEEDLKVLKLWDENFKIVDGHVQIPIPLKDGVTTLPDNFIMALRSLHALGKRLLRNPKELKQYQVAMKKNFDHGYAEHVPKEELDFLGLVWYLLHHGVDHPRKQDVTRVVAHGTAKYKGVSLATVTYKGPDLMNSLYSVLIKFRQFEHATTGDIEGMFNQVKVPPPQRNLQRFLYWEDGDPTKKIIVCRMTGHIFGTGWAPSAANYALKKLAQVAVNRYEAGVVKSVLDEFYVDDWLNSEPNEEESEKRVRDVRRLVKEGHFNLEKVLSNSRKVLQSIEHKARAKELALIDLASDLLPKGVMLGQLWSPQSDDFGFQFTPEPKPLTRRGLSSCVASVYDPIGLLCPFLVPAKAMLREVCKSGAAWDDPLDTEVGEQWSRWLQDLEKVGKVTIRRWLGCTKTSINRLHVFGDACFLAYGAVAYLVVFEPKLNTRRSLLISSKSKLAPTQLKTIPRLELCAATLAVKLELALQESFSIKLEQSRFYSDSDIVLKMLLRDPADFEPFSRNRVSYIKEHTTKEQWIFIPGKQNPADLASRGCSIDVLADSELWRFGPAVIRQADAVCLGQMQLEELPIDFPELRTKKPIYLAAGKEAEAVYVQTRSMKAKGENDNENDGRAKSESGEPSQDESKKRKMNDNDDKMRKIRRIGNKEEDRTEESSKRKRDDSQEMEQNKKVRHASGESSKRKRDGDQEVVQNKKARHEVVYADMMRPLLVRYSSRVRTVRAVAWILRARDGLVTSKWRVGELTVDEIKRAEKQVVMINQKIYLTQQQLTSRKCEKLAVKEIDGVWSVGGRLQYSEFAETVKHPWIVPEECPLAEQLICEAHDKVAHGGVERTVLEIRCGYWILSARKETRRVLGKCIVCRRYKAPLESQLMAPLPAHRLVTGKPPFHSTGVDLFGPLMVTLKRSMVKRFGVLYTCMTSRAIHLEVAKDLSMSSFINTFERFIARRGKPARVQSDNGTNLVGARNQVLVVQKLMTDPKLEKTMVNRGVEWYTNTPAASHQGGAWERQIRTVRSILMVLVNGESLDDDRLQTTLCLVEGIVNGRPLTRLTEELDADEPLTPTHLLNVRSSCPLFPQDFTGERLRKDWVQAQRLCDLFWDRWLKSYLPELQRKTKWSVHRKNVEEGELVLVMNDCLPRGRWPLAIVKHVHPGPDGVVRNVTVKLATGELRRPIQKVVRLEADTG